MNLNDPEYNRLLWEYCHAEAERLDKERQERIMRGVMRLIREAGEEMSTECCPVCNGKGRLEIILGSIDDR